MPGQGLYYLTLTKTFRAKNCDSNNYGVSNITTGLAPFTCRDCELLAGKCWLQQLTSCWLRACCALAPLNNLNVTFNPCRPHRHDDEH
jgi:hypothetical protein